MLDSANPLYLIQVGSQSESKNDATSETNSGDQQANSSAPVTLFNSGSDESSWMTLIDLVQSCELQLNPLADLNKNFDTATDTFFESLESLEGQ